MQATISTALVVMPKTAGMESNANSRSASPIASGEHQHRHRPLAGRTAVATGAAVRSPACPARALPSQDISRRVLLRGAARAAPEQSGSGPQQEGAERVEQPGGVADRRDAGHDEDRPQHQRERDARDQDALLAGGRHRETGVMMTRR